MPVSYKPSTDTTNSHTFKVPDYPEAADGPLAFKNFALDLSLIIPPIGSILPFVGDAAPTGWFICDGSTKTNTSAPALAVLCGTKFGSAPAGSFRLPNLRGRSIFGVDTSQTEFDVVGKTGGGKNTTITLANFPAHKHNVASHEHTASATITVSNPPASGAGSTLHTHGLTGTTDLGGSHSHGGVVSASSVTVNNNTTTGGSAARIGSVSNTQSGTASSHSHGIATAGVPHIHPATADIVVSSAPAVDTNEVGAADPTPLPTLSPSLAMNFIIRAA